MVVTYFVVHESFQTSDTFICTLPLCFTVKATCRNCGKHNSITSTTHIQCKNKCMQTSSFVSLIKDIKDQIHVKWVQWGTPPPQNKTFLSTTGRSRIDVLVKVNDADSNEGLKYNHNVSAISSLINKFTAHINFQYKGHHFWLQRQVQQNCCFKHF